MTSTYRYHMYYAGCADKDEMIGVAMSHDLKEWWRPESNPIIPWGRPDSYDSHQTSNPCVIDRGTGLTMIYQAKDKYGVFRFGRADSTDGIEWKKFPAPVLSTIPLDNTTQAPYREGIQHPHVVAIPGGWRLYFIESRNGAHTLRFAESVDLQHFKISEHICLKQETAHESYAIYYPWIARLNNEWLMWYSAVEKRDGNRVWHLARAVSDDGIHWRRSPAEPILIGSPKNVGGHLMRRTLQRVPQQLVDRMVGRGVLRSSSLANPSVVSENGELPLTMYYHAALPDGGTGIGRMQSDDGIAWSHKEDMVLGDRPAGWEHDFNADPFLLIRKSPDGSTREFEAVKRLLDQVPIERNSDLWVHSALRKLGGRNAQPKKIIEYLLERIGPEGTLLMPMFPMTGSTADYIRSGEPFDPRKTPPAMGVLPLVMFKEFPIERSLYPWVSVGAIGRHAKEYTATHHLSSWPMSKQSPFYKLYERKGKILLLGVGWERNSNLHIIENLRGDDYPYKTLADGAVAMKYIDANGQPQPVDVKMPLARKKTTDWNRWGETLARQYGFQQRFEQGGLSCLFIDAHEMLDGIEKGLDNGVYPYTPEFTPEMRKTWPLIRLKNLGTKAISTVSRRLSAR
jgi:aminoglycoside 3-N-acetyltransferase